MTMEGYKMSHNIREERNTEAERIQVHPDAASAAADDGEHDKGGPAQCGVGEKGAYNGGSQFEVHDM